MQKDPRRNSGSIVVKAKRFRRLLDCPPPHELKIFKFSKRIVFSERVAFI